MRKLTVFALTLAMLALASACASGDNANNSNAANANRDGWDVNVSEADYERRKDEFTQKAKTAGDTIGSGLKDGWLHVKTRAARSGESADLFPDR